MLVFIYVCGIMCISTQGRDTMTDTIDIPMIEVQSCLMMIAPKGAKKLTKALQSDIDTRTYHLFDDPLEAWKMKEQVSEETNSPWVIWEIADGLDTIAVIETREEFEQFYSGWV